MKKYLLFFIFFLTIACKENKEVEVKPNNTYLYHGNFEIRLPDGYSLVDVYGNGEFNIRGENTDIQIMADNKKIKNPDKFNPNNFKALFSDELGWNFPQYQNLSTDTFESAGRTWYLIRNINKSDMQWPRYQYIYCSVNDNRLLLFEFEDNINDENKIEKVKNIISTIKIIQ